MHDVNALLSIYAHNFPTDQEGATLIKKAYAYAYDAHAHQKRANGESYMTHVFQTALSLARWKLDAATIAAGLLHDTIEDCNIPIAEITKNFGEEISFLVEGVTKLSTLRYQGIERNVESLRKMILAVTHDLRVIFIKLADRMHNMKTLASLPPAKQKRIAAETEEVYAPLASRLGMQSVAGILEDFAFPYTHPEAAAWIEKNITESFHERNHYLGRVQPFVEEQLKKVNVAPISINYRAKRAASLYKKLLRYDMDIERVYDLVACRIIVNTIDECYLALGAIHQLWRPMPGRIKDYIALPKPNGYRSLHTTVFCLENRPTEFQIRTNDMHEESELGSAAHWFYETKKGSKEYLRKQAAEVDGKDVSIVRQLQEWQNQFPGSQEFIEALRVDLFSDRIFVLTPTGEVIDLPVTSTPIDFAYRIHSEVGNSCIGAKVNNKIVPLDYQLQSGDIVEILTQKNKKPSDAWVQMAKTKYAIKKIKSSVKRKIALPKKTEYRITCTKRVGMLKDISTVFSRNHITITHVHSFDNEKFPLIKITADIDTREKAEQILLKIQKVQDVKEISYTLI